MKQLLLELYNTSMLIAKNSKELTEQDKSIIEDVISTLLHAIND